MGFRCEKGGNGVELVDQIVLEWGPAIAESKSVWRVEGMAAQLAGDMHTKRPMADSGGLGSDEGLWPHNSLLGRGSGGVWRVGMPPLYFVPFVFGIWNIGGLDC